MRTAAMFAAAAALTVAFPALADDDIAREGVGDRRRDLNAMELAPFPAEAWASLTSWTNGEAPSAESLKGKVVMIATFAGWNPTARQELSRTQRMHRRHADDGLVVIGVHHPTGWDQAADALAEKKVEHLVAHDAEGKFRQTLQVDQDPDYYFIDRAGNLRFADVRSESVSDAVDLLLGESAEAAAAMPEQSAAQRQQRIRDARRSRDVNGAFKPGTRVSVEFEAPNESEYESTRWPWRGLMIGEAETQREAARELLTGEEERAAVPITFSEDNWYTSKPDTSGRVVVFYAITPFWPLTHGMIEHMNRLQDNYLADVDVIGGAYARDELDLDGQGGGGHNEAKDKLLRWKRTEIEKMFATRRLNHSILLDPPESNQLGLEKLRNRTTRRGTPILRGPAVDTWTICFIASSDGQIRYIGHPHWDSFERALKAIIDADPGVRARRQAEAIQRRTP